MFRNWCEINIYFKLNVFLWHWNLSYNFKLFFKLFLTKIHLKFDEYVIAVSARWRRVGFIAKNLLLLTTTWANGDSFGFARGALEALPQRTAPKPEMTNCVKMQKAMNEEQQKFVFTQINQFIIKQNMNYRKYNTIERKRKQCLALKSKPILPQNAIKPFAIYKRVTKSSTA